MTKDDDDLLLAGISERNLAKVANALERGADPNTAKFPPVSALHMAATLGPLAVVDAMIRSGAAVDAGDDDRNRTPLHSAVMSVAADAEQIVGLLLKAGANANARDADGYTPLDVAVAVGNRPAAKQVREAGGVRTKRHWGIAARLLDEQLSRRHGRD